MKFFLLFLLLSLGQLVSGQSANIDSISKITFQYSKGHYSFGISGQYSIYETIEYSRKDSLSFTISTYYQVRKSYDSIADRITSDTTIIKAGNLKSDKELVSNLIVELNNSKDNFTSTYVKHFLVKPNKKEVFGIANRYDLQWKFENDYSNREDRQTCLRDIRKFNYLDTFLNKVKPLQNSDLLVMIDVWNFLSIKCLLGSDTVEYRCDFIDFPAQPILRYDNGNYLTVKKVTNLQVNQAIKKLVPPKSIISSVVDLERMKEKYIKWYLDNFM